VEFLSRLENTDQIIICDLVLLEILQGARDDLQAARLQRALSKFRTADTLNERLAIRAAHNFRRLRSFGITIRKSNDLIIGTYCIEHGHSLLHNDRDFRPMVEHLGLVEI
jgi:predicted nucleic acid-binding protein